MDRDRIAADADAYTIGLQEGLEEGRKQGIAMEQSRRRQVEWARFFAYQVMACVIGCGIILAAAIGLTNLPRRCGTERPPSSSVAQTGAHRNGNRDMRTRPQCKIAGCTRLGASKGKKVGYSHLCQVHRKEFRKQNQKTNEETQAAADQMDTLPN
jgi:hypothetical protein